MQLDEFARWKSQPPSANFAPQGRHPVLHSHFQKLTTSLNLWGEEPAIPDMLSSAKNCHLANYEAMPCPILVKESVVQIFLQENI